MNWSFGRLENIIFPTSLQHLFLSDYLFNEPLPPGEFLPAGLLSLLFGPGFNQLLHNIILPATLQKLEFWTTRHCRKALRSCDFARISINRQTARLCHTAFRSQPTDNMVWPSSLIYLSFGFGFNQMLNRLTFPRGIQIYQPAPYRRPITDEILTEFVNRAVWRPLQ